MDKGRRQLASQDRDDLIDTGAPVDQRDGAGMRTAAQQHPQAGTENQDAVVDDVMRAATSGEHRYKRPAELIWDHSPGLLDGHEL